MNAIILLGAPGAGKGTVAEAIRTETPYIHVSTGDMLREAIKVGSAVGLEAKKFMDAGELVPDDVIIRMVGERMAKGAADDKYMFDGFPRTLEQARKLDETLAAQGAKITQVFLLEVSGEIVVERLSGRRICRACGAVYHLRNIPPRVAGVCDQCGGNDLYQRADDSEETVLNRLDVYRRQTESLVDYYGQKGLLIRIDAGMSARETHDALLAKLK